MNWINRYKKKTGRLDYERGVRDERERIIGEIEKQGVVIHKGELPKGIHGLLIDINKINHLK